MLNLSPYKNVATPLMVCVLEAELTEICHSVLPGAYPRGYKAIYTPQVVTHRISRDRTAIATSSPPGKYVKSTLNLYLKIS